MPTDQPSGKLKNETRKGDRLNILVIAARLPFRIDSGDRFRCYKFIAGLAQAGHTVDLLGFDEANTHASNDLAQLCRTVMVVPYADIEFQHQARSEQVRDMIAGGLRGYPRRVWQFHSPAMQHAAAQMVQRQHYDIVHFSELGVAELLATIPPQPRQGRVYDLIDAVSLSVHSSLRYRWDMTWPARWVESRQLAAFEAKIARQVDAAIFISRRDAAFLGNLPNAHVIPNGVDLLPAAAALRDIDIVFLGNMGARPNADAALWFAREVMPLVWAQRPEACFYIVGRQPGAEVRALAGERVVVTGETPSAVEYLQRARVAVAPMRIGAGLKNKVLEYLSAGTATVATAEANVGIDAPDGKALLIADEPQRQAAAVLRLLADEGLRAAMGSEGREFVAQHFSWGKIVASLEELYTQVLRT